jgi:hypothetical protein
MEETYKKNSKPNRVSKFIGAGEGYSGSPESYPSDEWRGTSPNCGTTLK